MNRNRKRVSPFSDAEMKELQELQNLRVTLEGDGIQNSGVRSQNSGGMNFSATARWGAPVSCLLPSIDVPFPSTTFVLMSDEPKWVAWARALQAIAQTGLHFSESEYDIERYRKILEIAVDIFADSSGESPAMIRGLFDGQSGYATPKVDVRGVVFRDDKLLLVRERSDGLWTLPGGWADVNDSPSEAVEREIVEESGFRAKAERMIAIFDRAKHGHEPPFPFHVYKLFILCGLKGGEARTTMETIGVEFAGENEIPPLSLSRVTREQIQFCFEARNNPDAPCRFD
jgi:ADP-ribose pyrophosphatase YjhB (NUDIX family)